MVDEASEVIESWWLLLDIDHFEHLVAFVFAVVFLYNGGYLGQIDER